MLEWIARNIDLFIAIFTFFGQYKFFQAFAVEALPGIDPELVDLQYNLRIDANFYYTVAALARVVSEYVKATQLIADEQLANNSQEIEVVTDDNNLTVLLSSNKASQLPGPQTKVTGVKVIRKSGNKRWQRGQMIEVFGVNPINNSNLQP